MLILGIDPGTATTGYGLVEESSGKIKAVDFGVFKTKPKDTAEIRLANLYHQLLIVLQRYRPHALALEKLFFGSNVTTAFSVGQARGVIMLAAAQHQIPINEYAPNEIKLAVCGYGKAEKIQIQMMVKSLLTLKTVPKPDDAADALAVAICHLNSAALSAKMR
jgi:crossover junction endodeoxyribonuclease RuvC